MNKRFEDMVLIGVLKNRRDLNLVLRKKWYRIPLLHAPKRKAGFIAFYQPSIFGRFGKRIRYYAKIKDFDIVKRREILPQETDHSMADEDYYLMNFEEIKKLSRPIINKNRMRISFGFTTLRRLLKAKTMLELFDIPPIEEMLSQALAGSDIKASREYTFSMHNGKKYRLDFVIFCKSKPLNIECDGERSHSHRFQRMRDTLRDKDLKKEGWSILRLKEKDIVWNIEKCINKIITKINKLGGTKNYVINSERK